MADHRPGGGKLDGTSSEGFFLREKGTREELKIAVNVAIERFRQDEDQKEFTFPSSLTSAERAYVHRYCQKFGLKTKSHGQGSQRSLSVFKKEREISMSSSELKLSSTSLDNIDKLLKKFPVTNKDKQEVGHKKVFKRPGHENNKNSIKEGKFLPGSAPIVPPKVKENDAAAARMKLPIYSFRDKLLKFTKANQVMLVTGDTGCGKTTQVPQYILEDATKRQQTCKIICTQPRRISAISVAERVAYERGESVGQAVGYQIRLESRVSPKTSLLFCTNGVLLRMLMSGHKALSSVSHIVIDEIHERDKYSDYLLICIRDHLKSYKNLRVILMSAALNVKLFKEYFGGCQVVHIPAMCHSIETFFLEDVLRITGYKNKAMKSLTMKAATDQVKELNKNLTVGSIKVLKKKDTDANSKDGPDVNEEQVKKDSEDDGDHSSSADSGSVADLPEVDNASTISSSTQDLSIIDNDESHCLEPEVRQEMDSCLKTAWVDGNEDVFDQILHFIFNENVKIDYRHSETTMTTLMVASARGFANLVERLLDLGADPKLKDAKQNWSSIDWARNFNQNHILQMFDLFLETHHDEAEEGANEDEMKMSKEDEEQLELYHSTFDDDKVDHSLILCLISHICRTKQDGAILVFLPGYDDIVAMKDRLFGDKEFSKSNKYVVFMLHSMMQISSQRKVFRRPPSGVRKIILATNIAETSVTIDDVVFVIDSGKVKEKSYDALTSVSALRCVWISKANALQRRGRAGRCRPGHCYHLMSEHRFHSLALYQDAEILRTPIHELCLQTKLLAAVNVSIADFLSKSIEAPPYLMIKNSISLLKSIDAIDNDEELTEMGKILVDLPIDPRFGKMLLFGILLKCVDPILTIATCLSYRDPFVLPSNVEDKRHAYSAKLKFSGLSFSDHIALSKSFKLWSRAKEEGNEASFCAKNFISNATMEMISGMRSQLISHLKNIGLIRSRGAGDMKDLNSNSQNWSVIKAVVLTGAYPALLKIDRESGRMVSDMEKNIRIHPSSVLFPTDGKDPQSVSQSIVAKLPFDWLYFDEMTSMHRAVQVRCVTALPAVAVALLAGSSLAVDEDNFRRSSDQSSYSKDAGGHEMSDSENEGESKGELLIERATLKIDDWIQFQGDDEVLEMILLLKTKFLSSFVRRVSSDGRSWSHADDAIVQCVVNLLSEEENPSTKSQSYSRERPNRKTSNDEKNDRMPSRSSVNRGSPRERGGRGPHQRSRYETRGRSFGNANGRNGVEDASRACAGEEENVKERQGGDGSARRDRYFIVKCNNYKNLEIAMSRGIWATTRSNEKKLDRAYREGATVYLIFSIQGSGSFQGYAKMISEVSNEMCPDFGSSNLGGIFSIQWICKGDIPFHFTQDLTNPWNENKKVQISRDSQELEPSVGAALCALWNQLEQPYNFQQSQEQAVPSGVEYQGEQIVTLQQAQQAYAVMDGQTQAQVFIADGSQQPGGLYGPSYASTEVHEMAPPYHTQAMYAPHHMTSFAPQQLMQSRYPPAEMFPVHPQAFLQYRRQGGYNPRSVHYYQHPY